MTIIHPFDPSLKLVQARNYQLVDPRKPRQVTLVVTHSMEAPDKPDTAEGVAAWFAGHLAPEASAHICADMNSLVACVLPKDIAWGCGGGNWCGYQVEFAGYAKQTRPDWLAPDNMSMLSLAAVHVAKAMQFFGIPVRALDEEETAECLRDACILQGKMHGAVAGNAGGIVTHSRVNGAWKNWREYGLPEPKGDLSHTDPGANFPMDVFVRMITDLVSEPEPFPLPPNEVA